MVHLVFLDSLCCTGSCGTYPQRAVFRSMAVGFSDREGGMGATGGIDAPNFGTSAFPRLSRCFLSMPVFFFGLGLYRAWIEIAFIGSAFPAVFEGFCGQDVFDASMAATLLICALAFRNRGFVCGRRWVYIFSGTALLAATLLLFAVGALPKPFVAPVAATSAILGGGGVAFVILLWSELYSRLDSVRVVLCYSVSMALAAFAVYVCLGLLPAWFMAAAALLPLASLACVAAGFGVLPESDPSQSRRASIRTPWTLIALMAMFAAAYGMGSRDAETFVLGPHSALGTLAVAVVLFAYVSLRRQRLDVDALCRFALPIPAAALLVAPAIGGFSREAADFCMNASCAAFSVFAMVVCAGLSRSCGLSPVWIFGIERAARALACMAGRHAGSLIAPFADPRQAAGVLMLACAVAFAGALLVRRDAFRWWEWVFADRGRDEVLYEKRCRALASECGLSAREEEVLALLGRDEGLAAIERELVIAEGTAKTHIRHVYCKTGVHSRRELMERLGVR